VSSALPNFSFCFALYLFSLILPNTVWYEATRTHIDTQARHFVHRTHSTQLNSSPFNLTFVVGEATQTSTGCHTCIASNPQSHRRGGVAILVRSDIRHNALQPLNEEFFRSAPIALLCANDNKNDMYSVFKWSSAHFKKLLKHFDSLSGRPASSFLLCGDLNA